MASGSDNVLCPGCGTSLQKKSLPKHQRLVCGNRDRNANDVDDAVDDTGDVTLSPESSNVADGVVQKLKQEKKRRETAERECQDERNRRKTAEDALEKATKDLNTVNGEFDKATRDLNKINGEYAEAKEQLAKFERLANELFQNK